MIAVALPVVVGISRRSRIDGVRRLRCAKSPSRAPRNGCCAHPPRSTHGSSSPFPSATPALPPCPKRTDVNNAGGSVLDDHNPPKWVSFACRFTGVQRCEFVNLTHRRGSRCNGRIRDFVAAELHPNHFAMPRKACAAKQVRLEAYAVKASHIAQNGKTVNPQTITSFWA